MSAQLILFKIHYKIFISMGFFMLDYFQTLYHQFIFLQLISNAFHCPNKGSTDDM